MPPKFVHPKNNTKVKSKNFVAQGKCTDVTKVSGYAIKRGTTTRIPGTVLPSTAKKHFGLVFRNLADGVYTLFVDETSSPVTTDSVEITVENAIPSTPSPPTVTAPIAFEGVATVFYPYGSASPALTNVEFLGSSGSPTMPTIPFTQIPGESFWTATVEVPSSFPTGPGNNYKLDVVNSVGPTTVDNLTINP